MKSSRALMKITKTTKKGTRPPPSREEVKREEKEVALFERAFFQLRVSVRLNLVVVMGF
jgi:hypothetical protein